MMWCVWGLSLGVWTGTGTLETHGQTVENTFTLLLSLRKRVFSHSWSRNGGTHCNGTLDINGCIEIKKGVD